MPVLKDCYYHKKEAYGEWGIRLAGKGGTPIASKGKQAGPTRGHLAEKKKKDSAKAQGKNGRQKGHGPSSKSHAVKKERRLDGEVEV